MILNYFLDILSIDNNMYVINIPINNDAFFIESDCRYRYLLDKHFYEKGFSIDALTHCC